MLILAYTHLNLPFSTSTTTTGFLTSSVESTLTTVAGPLFINYLPKIMLFPNTYQNIAYLSFLILYYTLILAYTHLYITFCTSLTTTGLLTSTVESILTTVAGPLFINYLPKILLFPNTYYNISYLSFLILYYTVILAYTHLNLTFRTSLTITGFLTSTVESTLTTVAGPLFINYLPKILLFQNTYHNIFYLSSPYLYYTLILV